MSDHQQYLSEPAVSQNGRAPRISGAMALQLMHTPLMQRREKERDALFAPVQRHADPVHQYSEAMVATVSQLTGRSIDPYIQLNSALPAQYGAHAIRQGNQVDIAPGQLKHLGHELTHVTQGAVQATTHVNGAPVNDDRGLESHADSVGATAHWMVVGELGFDPT